MHKSCLYHIVTLFSLCWMISCKPSENKVDYLPTKHVDTGVYKQLNNKFGVTVHKAQNYLGGLMPNYPIALCSQRVLDSNFKRVIIDSDWVSGFFVPSARKIIIKKDSGYVMINNREELKKVYAPISTAEEALGYATLYNLSFAAFDDFFNAKNYKYAGEKPKASYAKEKSDAYEVHLFSFQAFGCDHPYFSEIYEVKQDGSVRLVSKKRSFTDPKDDGVCVD